MTTTPAAGTSGKATASLVLGILGFFCCPIILSVGAIILATQAKNDIAANPGLGGSGMAQAGFIIGIIGLVWGIAGTGLYLGGVIG
jgi:hypothetical protein